MQRAKNPNALRFRDFACGSTPSFSRAFGENSSNRVDNDLPCRFLPAIISTTQQLNKSPTVDGEEVMSYEKPQLDPEDPYFQKLLPEDGNLILHKGTISIQAESHPTDFRKIELLILNSD